MAGGKGGTQTVTQTIPKWQEDEIKEAISRAKGLNTPYAPFMGIDVIAQDPNINANTNSALSAFGMTPIGNMMPPTVTENGMTGFRSYDLYKDQLNKLQENYPDLFRRIEQQTAEVPMASPVGTTNPVTGMPVSVQPSSSNNNNDDDNYFPPVPNSNDTGEYGFFGSGNPGTMSIDTSYNPITDFVDYMTGGYDYPTDEGVVDNSVNIPTNQSSYNAEIEQSDWDDVIST